MRRLPRRLPLLLALALTCSGCIAPTRVLTVGQDPSTKQLTIHAENSWFGGPVEGEVEYRAPDGTYFRGRFGATGEVDAALAARLAQEASLRDALARMEALVRLAAAAYGVTPPASLPAPGAAPAQR